MRNIAEVTTAVARGDLSRKITVDVRGEIEVVGEAANGREALEQTKTLAPRVVVMDLMMPELCGIEATIQITQKFPGTRIMIMSFESREVLVKQAFLAGAAGFMLKDFHPDELAVAVQALARGE